MLKPPSESIQEIYRKTGFFGKTAIILATWFGCGCIRFAPGTFGTLGAVPLVLGFCRIESPYQIPAMALFTVIAVWSSSYTESLLGTKDPSQVVIDEVAGFLLAMSFLPVSLQTLGLGFVLFRVIDIWKPFPIKQSERYGKGVGIVLDDLLAGLYAGAGVWGIRLLTNS